MTNVTRGPWRPRAADRRASPPPGVGRGQAALRAALVAAVALALGFGVSQYLGTAEAAQVAPSDLPTVRGEGVWYPGSSMAYGVWKTTVAEGQQCRYRKSSTEAYGVSGGHTDSIKATPGVMTVTAQSSTLWIDFSGPCVWRKAG